MEEFLAECAVFEAMRSPFVFIVVDFLLTI